MNTTSPPSRPLRSLPSDLFELLGSMRFAVSLLMFICVASVLGTVLVQNRSSNTYIDQFGPFWFEVFDKFSIWHVYNSWWFRSEEHTSELQSLMRISYAVFCLKKKKKIKFNQT